MEQIPSNSPTDRPSGAQEDAPIDMKLKIVYARVEELASRIPRDSDWNKALGIFAQNLHAARKALSEGREKRGNPISRSDIAAELQRMCDSYSGSTSLSILGGIHGSDIRNEFEEVLERTLAIAKTIRDYGGIELPSKTPMVEPAPGVSGWLPVWIKAVTKPNEQTFIEIASSPEASSKTAFIWVFIAGTLSGLVTGLIQMVLLAAGIQSQGFGQFSGAAGRGIGASLGVSICGAPVYGLISVIGFAIGVAIIQWIAKLFGGTGTFEKLAYAVAAITVPVTLVAMFLTPLSAVPYLGICTGLLSAGIGLYALFLQITAVKAVNGFGWGPAIGSVLLPGVVIGLVCACIVGVGAALLGPRIAEIFRQINQGLVP